VNQERSGLDIPFVGCAGHRDGNMMGPHQGVTVLWLPPAQQERNMRNVW
jgi:hypothetical protein